MADGRHLGKIEKLLYLSRDSSDFFEPLTAPTVKNLKFLKFKMAAAAILKNRHISSAV